MIIEYMGLNEISGSFAVLEGVSGVAYDEFVEINMEGHPTKSGRVVESWDDKVIIQVFEGTKELSLNNTQTRFVGRGLEIKLSEEILGRVFDSLGRPIDGLGEVYAEKRRDINGKAINPVSRVYPRDYIQTGISVIDGLTTMIRGQKLPVFSGNGLPHNALAAQIARQATLVRTKNKQPSGQDNDQDDPNERFAVVFAAMGVKNDVADYFRRTFDESGTSGRVVMFLNLASDPIAERLITPKAALTAAEYLAFEKNMHILVILTDMTAYAEAMREIASGRGEIPSRKGYPGYLYSELAALYERAGIVKKRGGSLTQIPILTMPNDDITHPVPDLSGYITEGQIVLDRALHQKGIYPPVNVLPSLSRLMKDGVGEGYTREDHLPLANQIFASVARSNDARALASVIGEDELSPTDKRYMEFGRRFEKDFINQGKYEDRGMNDTLNRAADLLSVLPLEELDRIPPEILERHYKSMITEPSQAR